MAKTNLTSQIDLALHKEFNKLGSFYCMEVTIGWYGKERVDGLCYNSKGEWRCFEVKVSKSDFYSKASKTFIGNYNYYAMPVDLYNQIKDDIPKEIGVYLYYPNKDESKLGTLACTKKPKRQDLGIDENILYSSMIRSLCRDACKYIDNQDENKLNYYKREMNRYQREYQQANRESIESRNKLYELLGYNYNDKIEHSDIGNGYPEWHFKNGYKLIKEN